MYASTGHSSRSHRYKRSRLIKEMATNLNRNEDSIASSTGSAHGTVSSEDTLTESIRQEESLHEIPNFDYLDDSDSFGFHPGRDGAINSTGALDISYSDMKKMLRDKDAKAKVQKDKVARQKAENDSAKLPELRATAKKYGKWSPRKGQVSHVIDTSAIGKVFPDFSGGIDSEDDLSRDLGRVRESHTGNDILVFQDVPGHPDSPIVTVGGMQVTATPNQAHIDKLRSIPLQTATHASMNRAHQFTGSDYSVGPSTVKSVSKNEVFITKVNKHTTSKSIDTIEIECSQSPSKYANLTSKSLDTLEINGYQASQKRSHRHSTPSLGDLSLQDLSVTGNKENIVPQSSPPPRAHTASPPRSAIRGSVKSRFQARVRDEFESSRLSIGSQHDVSQTQDPVHDISVLSARSSVPEEASFVSLRSAANKQRDLTFESIQSDRYQEEQSGSVIINRRERDATVESSRSKMQDDEEPASILTDIVLQGAAIAPDAVDNDKQRDVSVTSNGTTLKTKRELSSTTSGTIMPKKSTHSKGSWSSRRQTRARTESSEYQSRPQQNAHSAVTKASDYLTPNFTVMSFIAPFKIIPTPHKSPSPAELGLPSIQNGRVIRRNQVSLSGSFDAINAFELPDDEEDIYQMCESQKVRIAVLEEERAMQQEQIKLMQESMAAMKQQLAELGSSEQQKWKSHKCVDTKLQENFNRLQVSSAQIKYECNTLKKENLELKLAKHELETHQCVDTQLELENAQLRTDIKALRDERDDHRCVDNELEEENEKLCNELERWDGHVCKDEKLEKEVRLLREFKNGILGVVKERGGSASPPRR